MASKFGTTNPVIRDHEINGCSVRMTIDENGISFIRKGDKHRTKASVSVDWTTILESCDDHVYAELGFTKTNGNINGNGSHEEEPPVSANA